MEIEIIVVLPTKSPRWRSRLVAVNVRPGAIRRCAQERRIGHQIVVRHCSGYAGSYSAAYRGVPATADTIFGGGLNARWQG